MKLGCMVCGRLRKATEKKFPYTKMGKKDVGYCECGKSELEHIHHRTKPCRTFTLKETRSETYTEGYICTVCVKKELKKENARKI